MLSYMHALEIMQQYSQVLAAAEELLLTTRSLRCQSAALHQSMLDMWPASVPRATQIASLHARVELRLLDIPAVLELLSGLPEQHFPVAWAESSMENLGMHTGLSSSRREKPCDSKGSPETPPDLLTKVGWCTAQFALADLSLCWKQGACCGRFLCQQQQQSMAKPYCRCYS